jgi:hypothetical protein
MKRWLRPRRRTDASFTGPFGRDRDRNETSSGPIRCGANATQPARANALLRRTRRHSAFLDGTPEWRGKCLPANPPGALTCRRTPHTIHRVGWPGRE